MIGTTLSRYAILEQIGAGGMGVVYRARDQQLDREVAVKVLPPGSLADDAARKRFRKEALALAKLNHPNIETVFDFGTENGIDFLVTEYIPGITLDARIAGGTMPERNVLRLGIQLAEGLEAAHSQGIIHRDLKPGNLRLTPDQRIKILDFGLARLAPQVSKTAQTESVSELRGLMGTVPYMAPEQLRGEKVDNRCDLWAAGAVLYELATGCRPFPETQTPRLIDSILNQPPRPPSSLNRHVAPVLEGIIIKCLEKDPENRYQSARELLVDLRRLSTGISAGVVPVRRPRRRWPVPVLVLAALLAALGIIAWRRGWLTGDRLQVQSLAVLPFENLSHDPEQEYLADGVTEELITDLGQIHGVGRVISRTSVMRYKTDHPPIRDIARQLKVDALVEGSILRSGDTIEVTARLINALTDAQVWSRTFQREARDLLSLQRELAFTIANEIRVKLTPEERRRLHNPNAGDPAANDAYLRASYLSRGTYEQRKKAREYFEQAVKIDPNFAPAYAGLADAYWGVPDQPAQKAMPMAKEYALKALALDDGLAHAHTALGSILFYGDWDWSAADRQFQRALELNRSDADAHQMYSVFLSAMGRFRQAEAEVQAAQELDPLSSKNDATAGWVLYCARQYDQALQQCQKALELTPNFDGGHACLGYNYLGKGSFRQAIDEFQKALTLSGGDAVRAVWLGRAYAQNNNTAQARAVLGQLRDQSTHTYIPPYFVATLYTALGDKEQALSWLEKAYAERDLYLAWIKVDPAVDTLRSDPRFQALLRRMNL
jgi:TolB-like protein/Flp pilus assembly protein TadD